MMVMALKEKLDAEQARMVEEHHAHAQDVINCIRGIGEIGRKRITLLIQRAGEDGKGNTRSL